MLIKRFDRVVGAVGQKPASRANNWPNGPLIQADECHPKTRGATPPHGHSLAGGVAPETPIAFSKSARSSARPGPRGAAQLGLTAPTRRTTKANGWVVG